MSDDQKQTDDATDALAEALAALGGDGEAFVRIYRRTTEGRYAVCERLACTEFDPFTIAEVWGAGDYRFQFCGSGGRAIKNVTAHLLARRVAPVALPAETDRSELRELRESLERHRTENAAFTRDLLLKVIGSGGGGTSTADLLAVFREARESAASNRPAADMVLDLVRTGIELGSREHDNGGGMLEKLAPRVLGLLERFQSKPTQQIDAAGVPDDLLSLARAYVPQIVAEAQAGRDPYTWGAFVAERTPAAFRPVLAQICGMTPVERRALFARVDSRVLPYMAWLESAVVGITEVFYEGETDHAEPVLPATDSAGAPGDRGDASGHA